MSIEALREAINHHRQGRLEQAGALYRRLLEQQPGHLEGLCLLGDVESKLRHFDAAIDLFRRVLAQNPRYSSAHSNIGNALMSLQRFEQAVASFEAAIALDPADAGAWNNRGNALFALGLHRQAAASYERTLALRPNAAEVLVNHGNVQMELGRTEEALASFDRALANRSDYAAAHNSRASALYSLGRYEAALADYDRALALDPHYAEAQKNRGRTLRELKRPREALVSYDRALTLRPDHAATHTDRGTVLRELGRGDEALACYARALELNPDLAEARYNLGIALAGSGRHAEAAVEFARLVRSDPEFPLARGELLHSRLHCCEWEGYTEDVDRLIAATLSGRPASTPFAFLCASDRPEHQLACSVSYARRRPTVSAPARGGAARTLKPRFRIAYLSADFHDHATAHLMTGLIEHHDPSRFETFALSFGPDRDDEPRKRLERAVTRFIDVRRHSDLETATLIRQLNVDIAVDLKGYTRDSRPWILAHRPAPVQVSYLGFPGGMGADFIDYLLADRFVIPESQGGFYRESIAYLPECYQPNDQRRAIASTGLSRSDAGLPETGFVYCSFVAAYKITPMMFDCWMRLLARVPASVLWLLGDCAEAEDNLRRHARERGVDPGRLVFAPRARLDRHLARHRLADLFLDTLPVNAHTTASDALWAGLPVLTLAGAAFAGRVAGSLLTAVGLPELITHTLEDYEALAIELAGDAAKLGELRARLARNRLTHPLFDIDRLRRHVESAFVTMISRSRAGEPPVTFTVAAEP